MPHIRNGLPTTALRAARTDSASRPCRAKATDRFFDIAVTSSNVGAEKFITIDMRAGGYSAKKDARKITQLIVTRKDLVMALGNVKLSKD